MRGSVYKRGSTWTWHVDVGVDPVTGKRRQQTKGGFKTKRECQAALNDALAALRAGTFVEPSKRTLESFLVDEWLPALRHLRPSTLSNYRTHIRTCVLPTLGPIPLQQLSPAHLNAFYQALLSRGRLRDGHGMAPKTVQNVHAILHRALKDAMRWGYAARNVADAVDPPKGLPAERQVWTPEQLRAFLSHVRDDRLYAAWLLVATTGLRRAELAGLRWLDVDLAAGRVSPRRPRVVVDYTVLESDAKTPKGRRSLALDPATLAALKAHQARQAEEKTIIGSGYQDSGLIFTMPDGSPIHPQRLSAWVPAAHPRRRAAQDPAPRCPAQLRHRRAGGRRLAQGDQPAPRTRHHRDHDGHLQPRHPRPGRARRRDGRPPDPGRWRGHRRPVR
jgi:integrase